MNKTFEHGKAVAGKQLSGRFYLIQFTLTTANFYQAEHLPQPLPPFKERNRTEVHEASTDMRFRQPFIPVRRPNNALFPAPDLAFLPHLLFSWQSRPDISANGPYFSSCLRWEERQPGF